MHICQASKLFEHLTDFFETCVGLAAVDVFIYKIFHLFCFKTRGTLKFNVPYHVYLLAII
jgi:hypothetical protein